MIPIVIENLLPPELQEQVKEELKNQATFKFNESTSGNALKDPDDTNIKETPQMVHNMIEEDCPLSFLAPLGFDICNYIEQALEIKILHYARIKANLIFQNPSYAGKYNTPHIDGPSENFLSLVYYVEDSDGDTIIFDKHVEEEPFGLTPTVRVSPKQGYAVAFASRYFHSSSVPVEHPTRLIINFVLEIRPEDYQKLFFQNT